MSQETTKRLKLAWEDHHFSERPDRGTIMENSNKDGTFMIQKSHREDVEIMQLRLLHRHLDWSDQQRRILTANGRAEQYYVAERGFPFTPAELPHAFISNNNNDISNNNSNLDRNASYTAFWDLTAPQRPPLSKLLHNQQTMVHRHNRHPVSTIVGAWNRTLFYGGYEHVTDHDEWVYNVQTHSLFVDLRIPKSRRAALLAAAAEAAESSNTAAEATAAAVPNGSTLLGDRDINDNHNHHSIHSNGDTKKLVPLSHITSWDDLSAAQLRVMARQHVFAGIAVVHDRTSDPQLAPSGYALCCTRYHALDWNYVGIPRSRPNKWWIDPCRYSSTDDPTAAAASTTAAAVADTTTTTTMATITTTITDPLEPSQQQQQQIQAPMIILDKPHPFPWSQDLQPSQLPPSPPHGAATAAAATTPLLSSSTPLPEAQPPPPPSLPPCPAITLSSKSSEPPPPIVLMWKEWAYSTDYAGQHYYCEHWERYSDREHHHGGNNYADDGIDNNHCNNQMIKPSMVVALRRRCRRRQQHTPRSFLPHTDTIHATTENGFHHHHHQQQQQQQPQEQPHPHLPAMNTNTKNNNSNNDNGNNNSNQENDEAETPDGILVIVDDHFNYCKTDMTWSELQGLYKVGDGASLTQCVDAALDRGDVHTARTWLRRIQGGHGRVSAGWRLDCDVQFWKEGSALWTKDQVSVVVSPSSPSQLSSSSLSSSSTSLSENDNKNNDSGKDPSSSAAAPLYLTSDCYVLWNGEEWEIYECSLSTVSELQDLLWTGLY